MIMIVVSSCSALGVLGSCYRLVDDVLGAQSCGDKAQHSVSDIDTEIPPGPTCSIHASHSGHVVRGTASSSAASSSNHQ